MEHVVCGLCGADDAAPLLRTWDRSHGLPGSFRYVRCRRCELVYLDPRPGPAEISAYYPDGYKEYTVSPIREERRWLVRLNRLYGMAKRCRVVTRRLAPGRLLDVGCGAGVFMDEMRRRGWDVQGLDTSAHAVERARRYGLEVVHGELGAAAYASDSFDAVTLWNVVEHVPEPRHFLTEVARITRAGGLIVAATPNAASFEARAFGQYWAQWEAPRHFQVFTPNTLGRALVRVGFREPRAEYVVGAWYGLISSAQFAYEAWRGWGPGRGDFGRRYWDSHPAAPAARLVAQPALWLIDRAGLGSSMVVTARRR